MQNSKTSKQANPWDFTVAASLTVCLIVPLSEPVTGLIVTTAINFTVRKAQPVTILATFSNSDTQWVVSICWITRHNKLTLHNVCRIASGFEHSQLTLKHVTSCHLVLGFLFQNKILFLCKKATKKLRLELLRSSSNYLQLPPSTKKQLFPLYLPLNRGFPLCSRHHTTPPKEVVFWNKVINLTILLSHNSSTVLQCSIWQDSK